MTDVSEPTGVTETYQTVSENEKIRPLDFSTFVVSLGTSALVQLGEAPDPTTGGRLNPDLAGARQTIDLLGIIEQKTQGNLSESEEILLKSLLRDLRLRHIAARSGGSDA